MKIEVIEPTIINKKVRLKKEKLDLPDNIAVPLIRRGRVRPLKKSTVEQATQTAPENTAIRQGRRGK